MKTSCEQELYRTVGSMLRTLRRSRHLTQETFAQQLGVSRNGYQQVELGRHLPGFQLMVRLEKEYGMDFRALHGLVLRAGEQRRASREQMERARKAERTAGKRGERR